MKYLYLMDAAPAGFYYTEQTVRERVPLIEMDRKKEKALVFECLWYDKYGRAWGIVDVDGTTGFSTKDDAIRALAGYLDSMEVPFQFAF